MLNDILNSSYKGIKGVKVIDSGNPGKNIGIFAVTHGNEPVGFLIFNYLLKDFNIEKKIKKGKLFLIAVNIEAYNRYIESGDINKFRFIDDNMNRISNKKFKPESTEFNRLKELEIVFKEIDIAIDLHSVSKGNDLIGISDINNMEKAKIFFDVETLLVDNLGKTGALIGYFLRNNKEAYGLECGNHIDDKGFLNGLKNIINFLIYTEIIFGSINIINKNYDIFKFLEEIKPKSSSFKYLKDYNGFSLILPNKIYAKDGKIKYQNLYGEDIYLGIVAKNPNRIDGAGFLFKKLI